MNISEELLKQKNLSSLQKLIILLILDEPEIAIKWVGGLSMTSSEMAKALGESRRTILEELENLQAMDYITCRVEKPHRITNVTNKLVELLKKA